MENKILTAEEFCREKHKKIDPRTSWIDFNKEVMIEFAKLHVEAALKAAAENAEWEYPDSVSAKSILNSYTLDNIK